MYAAMLAYIIVVRLLVLVRQEQSEKEEPSRDPVLLLSLCVAIAATLSQGYPNAVSLGVFHDMFELLRPSTRSREAIMVYLMYR